MITSFKKGMTLAEAIIYIAILAILATTVTKSVVSMAGSYGKVKTANSITLSALSAFDRFSRDIRNASVIDTVGSNFGASDGKLSITTVDAGETPASEVFYLTGGAIRLSINGVDKGPLTFSDVNVTGLVFRTFESGISKGVKIEMTMESDGRSESFNSSYVLRGSY